MTKGGAMTWEDCVELHPQVLCEKPVMGDAHQPNT
ncbi:MAG: hypothetical protein JWP03_1835 [Phycisphaerales bacterium]|nr:hypothetical protein [Phycisphaerales bacterium]